MIIGAVALLTLFFPAIKGRYQYNRFLTAVQVGISREDVKKTAADIGYERHDVEFP